MSERPPDDDDLFDCLALLADDADSLSAFAAGDDAALLSPPPPAKRARKADPPATHPPPDADSASASASASESRSGSRPRSPPNPGCMPAPAVASTPADVSAVPASTPVPADASTPAPSDAAVAPSGAAPPATTLTQPPATSHTARCRAKVNTKFADLLRILPPPPPSVPVKHKAQVLAYACSVIEGIAARQSSLEAELLLTHPARLEGWLLANVASRATMSEALEPVLRLLMSRTGWKCGDAWLPASNDPAAPLRCSLSIVQAGRPRSDPLFTFAEASAPVVLGPTVGVPGRVFASHRPEWLSTIEDPPTFVRAVVARRVGVGSCFALPITNRGNVVAVVAVYDTCHREYDGDVVDLSQEICRAVNRTIADMPFCVSAAAMEKN